MTNLTAKNLTDLLNSLKDETFHGSIVKLNALFFLRQVPEDFKISGCRARLHGQEDVAFLINFLLEYYPLIPYPFETVEAILKDDSREKLLQRYSGYSYESFLDKNGF